MYISRNFWFNYLFFKNQSKINIKKSMEMDDGWPVQPKVSVLYATSKANGDPRSIPPMEVLGAIASEAIFLVGLPVAHLDCQSPPPSAGGARRVTLVRTRERDSRQSPGSMPRL
jgi:hypothetical protein